MDVLYCIKNGYLDSNEQFCTVGNTYNVVSKNKECILIEDDLGFSHAMSNTYWKQYFTDVPISTNRRQG